MAPGLSASALPDALAGELHRRVAAVQRADRLPALSVAVSRPGRAVFTSGAGSPPPAPDVQFRIGSITKTFTAVLVLQLRDEGLLRLDDELGAHLPALDREVGATRVRDLLGHVAGLTREPRGAFWEASPGVAGKELLRGLAPEDLVLPAGRARHYSNVAFGLLGLVVERIRRQAYPVVLRERLLLPLGLEATTWLPRTPHATGYRVHPFADEIREEPATDTAAMGPAGQLWSTPGDLVRWGAFLAGPDPAVLAPATVEEMCVPVSIRDPSAWTAGGGLGLQLWRRPCGGGERVLVGHGGSMPGFVAGLVVDRSTGVSAAAQGNAWFGSDLPELAGDLVVRVVQDDPPPPRPWVPVSTPPAQAELLGAWFYRGVELVAYSSGGLLHLAQPTQVRGPGAETFEQVGPDLFRGTNGDDFGELLRVVRDEAGRPVVLDLATWLLVRDPHDPRGGP